MKQDKNREGYQPLATKMRPTNLNEFIGQSSLLAVGKSLHTALMQGILHSMILWGPPGSGKTSLAELMAKQSKAKFVRFSAILAGVKDIRLAVEDAKQARENHQQATILFIDEIHRFNKAQQDILLPFIEEGIFILIGATTENPSFELNNALLSRTRVYVLHRLSEEELLKVLHQALQDKIKGLGQLTFLFPESLQYMVVRAADGDARQLLNLLEMIADFAEEKEGIRIVTEDLVSDILQHSLRRFDKQGEHFYDQISALHKSVRGSSPDAALYWLCRMLDGGCDPLYIARRMLRMANEDIGLADPRATDVAMSACQIYERLGSPEGELAIAQAIVYLACAPKSNAIYLAFNQAKQAAKMHGSLPVPVYLRNAPSQLMKNLKYGQGYRYAHDEPEGYAAGVNYFPEEMNNQIFYHPVSRGLETKIAERLAYFRNLDKQAVK